MSTKKLSKTERLKLFKEFQLTDTTKVAIGRKYGVSARTVGRILEEHSTKPKFTVGDLVTCRDRVDSTYVFTKHGTKCKVISYDAGDDTLRVQVVSFSKDQNSTLSNQLKSTIRANTYTVSACYFELVQEQLPFKVGDLVQYREDLEDTYHYTKKGCVCKVEGLDKDLGTKMMKVSLVSLDPEQEEVLTTSRKQSLYRYTFTVKSSLFELISETVEDSEEILSDPRIVKNALVYIDGISPKEIYEVFTVNQENNSAVLRSPVVFGGVATYAALSDLVYVGMITQERDEDSEVLEEIEEQSEPETNQEVVHVVQTSNSIMLNLNGATALINKSHPSFLQVTMLIEEGKYEQAKGLMDVKEAVKTFSNGRLVIKGENVLYDGHPIHHALVKKLLKMMEDGEAGFKSLMAFLENVLENPSLKTRERLMDFVEADDIEINEKGYVVAYKNCTYSFSSYHSGLWLKDEKGIWVYNANDHYDNSVGKSPEMPRGAVDDVETNTCSKGLHVCSLRYLRDGWSTSGKTVKVEIAPENFVAIPPDYKNSKARVSKYTVVEDITDSIDDLISNLD